VKNRRLPNLPSIYEELGYDSIGLPLQELAGNKEGPIVYNMYEHIGYDSINQVQEEIALREEKMHFSSEVYGYNKYDYIDESQRQAIGRGRPKPPLPDEGITCADRGHPIHSEDLSHSGYVDRHEVCRSDSFTNKDEHFPMLNGQSEELNTFSDINREELNPKLHLENSESNLKEISAYLELHGYHKSQSNFRSGFDKSESLFGSSFRRSKCLLGSGFIRSQSVLGSNF